MTGTIIKFVRKSENGYENINGVEILCKEDDVLAYLNREFAETGSKESTDFYTMFFGKFVTWEYDEEENAYFSRYEDGTITGEAFMVIRTKEW